MITHLEAAAIRVAIKGSMSARLNALIDGHENLVPSQDGIDLLREYDAHYTTVERVELERLRALERKIEAFMTSLELTGCHEDIVIDAGNVTLRHRHYKELGSSDWDVDAHDMLGSDADTFRDAIRQAFELFEVPGEGAKS